MATVSSSMLHATPKRSAIDENVMERWRAFFKMTANVSNEKRSLYAMGKLTQIALVNYMRLRGIYAEDVFIKRRYHEFKFFTLSTDQEDGIKLNDIMRSAGSFINISSLKALRFQLFHDPDKPNEVGEEIYFQFYYGKESRIELNFGNSDVVELDMTDCSFENFLHSFGEILGKIRSYCAHLSPLPPCEKRFRTSFCKKIPAGFNTGPFNVVSGTVEYAPKIQTKPVGAARLPTTAMAAIVRTCYSNEENDSLIEENTSQMVQAEINEILGQGDHDLFLEVPRRHSQVPEEQSYHNTIDESIIPPIVETSEIPAQDFVEEDSSVVDESSGENPTLIDTLLSPSYDRHSIVSFEAILEPFDRQPLVHESTIHIETTRTDSHDESGGSSDGGKSSNKPAPKKTTLAKGSNANKAGKNAQIDGIESSAEEEEDSHVLRRKGALKRKQSNREAIEELSKTRAPTKRRNIR